MGCHPILRADLGVSTEDNSPGRGRAAADPGISQGDPNPREACRKKHAATVLCFEFRSHFWCNTLCP